MTLYSLDSVTKSYGEELILTGVSFDVLAGDRIGLVGVNGSGKTTLLEVLSGLIEPNSGTVHRARSSSVSYLPQHPLVDEEKTVLEIALSAFDHVHEIEEKLREIESEMETAALDDLDELVLRHSRLQQTFDFYRGHTTLSRAEAILEGLGFPSADFDKRVAILSGGQKSRLALARILLEDSDLVLLDEPTNNLDIATLTWLEGTLTRLSRALVIISHDRTFLDRVATRIVHLRRGQVKSYRGNYSEFVLQREAENELLQKQSRLQVAEIQRQEDFIRRNLAGQKTKQAQSRRKRLEKTERIEVEGNDRSAAFSFRTLVRSGDLVLEARDLSMGFDGSDLFAGLSIELRRGERLGIVGRNGSGKSTLLSVLDGRLQPRQGTVRLGANVAPGFFDQEQKLLDRNKTVLEEIHDLVPTRTEESIRGFLGALRFTGDDVFKRIEDLSGGERARVALARLALLEPNLIVLDEPTNHLDLLTREVLEKALQAFDGTLIAVSHDRYFLDRVTNRTLLLGEEGGPRFFRESYPAVLRRLETERKAAEEEAAKTKREEGKNRRREARAAPTSPSRGSQGKKIPFKRLETMIIEAEAEIAAVEKQLSDPAIWSAAESTRPLVEKLDQARQRLATLNAEWETRIEEETAG